MCDYNGTTIATADIQQICNQLKYEVEEKTGKKYTVFIATLYRELDVTGFIYLIKVKVGEGDAIHLKVYQSKSKDFPILLGLQEGHNEHDVITPF